MGVMTHQGWEPCALLVPKVLQNRLGDLEFLSLPVLLIPLFTFCLPFYVMGLFLESP